MWGFITVLVDSLIPRLREVFELTFFQAGLVQFAFFMAYGLLSIPSGWILSKIGYKKGILLGLGIMGIGCLLFYPAASYRLFHLFLIGYFVLAGGMTVLQVAANPYVAVLGSEETASSRLNLSQAFNSLGTAIAPAFGALFLLSDSIKNSNDINNLSSTAKEAYLIAEASAVQNPFLVLAISLLLLAFVVSLIKLPNILKKKEGFGYSEALKHKVLKMGAVGIFLYVGAEVTIGSYLVNYFLDMNMAEIIKSTQWMSTISESILQQNLINVDNKAIVGAFVIFYWSGAMVGRFIGAYLTKIIEPSKVLAIFATMAITLLAISMLTNGLVAMISILLVGLFNSIMFPTIFTLSLSGLGNYKPQASGILCTAIVGGAIIPPLYGFFTDQFDFKPALFLMVICYFYIFYFARKSNSFIQSFTQN
ncbi:MAG: sugar MFS transporter [Lutibacter sp.]|uniref:sugar MFS transporter n=1 Tax=Lutibacter sp. TaxID=1925666 RepID=UPI0017EB8413|nr:sugar MFS transporter [Lutibacter sp.]MBT8318092.1 sugar MFS transporter [Lutibacter sp.]NNJ58952.1 sugar MFS transporter [Lutibacter sp.]